MALTLAGEMPDPRGAPGDRPLHPSRLPFLPYGAMGSDELAERIAAALSAPPEPLADAVLLERHGASRSGHPAAAVNRLELVEVLCRTWRDALLIRAARGHDGIVTG